MLTQTKAYCNTSFSPAKILTTKLRSGRVLSLSRPREILDLRYHFRINNLQLLSTLYNL